MIFTAYFAAVTESWTSAMLVACVPLFAIALDFCFGEPKRWHPLVGFGNVAAALERRFNCPQAARWRGVLAWLLMVAVPVGGAIFIEIITSHYMLLYSLLSAAVLYWAIGWQSLREHVFAVDSALIENDVARARLQVARIVSRDCSQITALEVRRAAIESTLENSSDAIIGPLFWFVIAGIPGVILYRLSNTLDAMWGYRNSRYFYFGWAAARMDDLLSFIPARLTAISFLLFGKARAGWSAWRRDAPQCASPNAGPVICAGAGALDLRLGGPCIYHGERYAKPWLGGERDPDAGDIRLALRLVNRCVLFWTVIAVVALAAGPSVRMLLERAHAG